MFKPFKNLLRYIQNFHIVQNVKVGDSATLGNVSKTDTTTTTMDGDKVENVECLTASQLETNPQQQQEQQNTATDQLIAQVSRAQYADYDEDDIETQIESSIMLKKPLKSESTSTITSITTATNTTTTTTTTTIHGIDVLTINKSPAFGTGTGSNIIVRHCDYKCNNRKTPLLDDELDDIRYDSNENFYNNNNNNNDEISTTRDEMMATTATDFINVTVNHDMKNEGEMEEDHFINFNNFSTNHLNVINESAANKYNDNNNDDDDGLPPNQDPLAIAQEEQEAFKVDRESVLKELNLLKPISMSSIQVEDVVSGTTVGDLECWLENDNEMQQKNDLLSSSSCKRDDEKKVTSCADERGDGSDSGLGSESSTLQTTIDSIASPLTLTTTTPRENENLTTTEQKCAAKRQENEKEQENENSTLVQEFSKPKRSNLKRPLDNDGNLNHNDKTLYNEKKSKRSITFSTVHVYYFARQQGFNCVPSAGGCTLGMAATHESCKIMTLAEHAAELRRAHRLQLQEINPRSSSSDDSEESEEDFLSEGSGSELDGETNGFLQPVSPKQRRALLKAAGVRKIDATERAECRDIRNSREVCGCNCRNYCDPDTCACNLAGIKCQVDRDMFPCGCARDSCANRVGRVEFNSERVHTHYIHTLVRLEMENQQENPYNIHTPSMVGVATPSTSISSSSSLPSSAAAAALIPTASATCNFYQSHMPTQSNYSSGYASPAYNTIAEQNQPLTALNDYYQNHHHQQQATAAQQNSAHLYDRHTAATTPLTTPLNPYSANSLNAGLYAATTSSYPNSMALPVYHNMNYENIPIQVSNASFSAYHHNTTYMDTTDVSMVSAIDMYSSCAVPSDPPYGTATTTESSVIEFAPTIPMASVLEITTAPSCVTDIASTIDGADTPGNFINLNVPEQNTSCSQINDLLHRSRNSTIIVPTLSLNRNETSNENHQDKDQPDFIGERKEAERQHDNLVDPTTELTTTMTNVTTTNS